MKHNAKQLKIFKGMGKSSSLDTEEMCSRKVSSFKVDFKQHLVGHEISFFFPAS